GVIAMSQIKEPKLIRCVHEPSSLAETYARIEQICQQFLEVPITYFLHPPISRQYQKPTSIQLTY
ncbi:MAG: hypothetical protein AB7P17_11310, partial [Nitrospirales bacterium]